MRKLSMLRVKRILPGGIDYVHTHLELPIFTIARRMIFTADTRRRRLAAPPVAIDFTGQSKGVPLVPESGYVVAKAEGKAVIDYGCMSP